MVEHIEIMFSVHYTLTLHVLKQTWLQKRNSVTNFKWRNLSCVILLIHGEEPKVLSPHVYSVLSARALVSGQKWKYALKLYISVLSPDLWQFKACLLMHGGVDFHNMFKILDRQYVLSYTLYSVKLPSVPLAKAFTIRQTFANEAPQAIVIASHIQQEEPQVCILYLSKRIQCTGT